MCDFAPPAGINMDHKQTAACNTIRRSGRIGWYLLAACLALGGCNETPQASKPIAPSPSAPVMAPLAADSNGNAPSKPSQYFYVTTLRMAVVQVPTGMISGSEDLWSYVDEEPVAAGRSAVLGRNGLRIGVGRRGGWDDVLKVLRKMTGRSISETSIAGIPGAPQHIVLKEQQPAQAIFISNPDQTVSGSDYPAGDAVLSLACSLSEDDPNSMIITGLPQIRSTARRPQIVRDETGLRMLDLPTMYPFTPLAFQLTIQRNDFLVVGPGVESRRKSSLGHIFLARQKEGLEFETVLIILPEVAKIPER